jgi:hypothetical protein
MREQARVIAGLAEYVEIFRRARNAGVDAYRIGTGDQERHAAGCEFVQDIVVECLGPATEALGIAFVATNVASDRFAELSFTFTEIPNLCRQGRESFRSQQCSRQISPLAPGLLIEISVQRNGHLAARFQMRARCEKR